MTEDVDALAVLDVPAPCDWITSNRRLHHLAVARRVKAWRTTAAFAARARKIPAAPTPVRIVATVHRAHNRGGRWDPANWAPTAKAIIDGLVDAGVLEDDSFRHVIGPDMRAGEPNPRAGVTITIYPAAGVP